MASKNLLPQGYQIPTAEQRSPTDGDVAWLAILSQTVSSDLSAEAKSRLASIAAGAKDPQVLARANAAIALNP